MTSIPVSRLNHAVLYVRDVDVAADFYKSVFGFEEVSRMRDFAVFLRAGGGDNHHDLGLFAVGADAPRAIRGSTGLAEHLRPGEFQALLLASVLGMVLLALAAR